MEKVIHKDIVFSTAKRGDNVFTDEFYSYDKNNAMFEFTVDEEIQANKVIALFYFTSTQRYFQTDASVLDGVIHVEFDTSVIVTDERVEGYLYFNAVEKNADVYQFAFDVRVSEIDKTKELPIEEKTTRRVVDITEIVTKTEMEALFERLNITGGYDDRPLIERIERLEGKTDKDTVYDDSEIKARIDVLESKQDKDTIYDDTAVKERLTALESKPDNDTVYDDTDIQKRITALENKPSAVYDDTTVKKRLYALEQKPDKDTIYDDTEIKQRVATLEEQAPIDLSEYAKKSELPTPIDATQFIKRTEFNPTELEGKLTALETDVKQAPKGKLGQNLLANSGNKITNKQYPTTYLSFAQQPTVGKKYTMTVKVDAPASKAGVVVSVRNNISLGAFNKVAEGIYSLTFDWKPNPSSNPYELVVYQPPNNGAEASLVWAKFVEGVDTDYTWYPNYNEVSNVYTFAEEASTAIESSANLLDGTLAEHISNSEFMNYADITRAIDKYGTGKYTLSFDIYTPLNGNVNVYISGTGKYTFLQETIKTSPDYTRYTLHLDMKVNDANATKTALSFFGGKYGNGVVPSIKRLRLSKGIYNELPWKPSDNELTELYEKLLGGQIIW